MSFRVPLAPFTCACAVGMSLALAACGGSSPGSPSAQEDGKEAAFVKFAKCLREHGINASSSLAGAVRVQSKGAPQQMEAAQNACKRYRPQGLAPNPTPQQKVERQEAVQKFAKCMREHGIHVEASASGGGIAIRIHSRAGEGPNPESPTFQAAQKACQGLLPFKGHPPGAQGPETSSAGPGGASGGSLSPAG